LKKQKKEKQEKQVEVFDAKSIFSEGSCEFVSLQDEREVIADLRYWQEKEFNFNYNERE